MAQTHFIATKDISAALDWWREAGVDCGFGDEATNWLAEPAPEEAKPKPKAAEISPRTDHAEGATAAEQQIDLLGDSPPADLAQFRSWWLGEPGLDSIGPRGRVAPQGNADAELMVLVMDPEQGDRDDLLSQQHGRLLDAMLRAMGTDRSRVYLASALPRHTPMADGTAMAAAGFDNVLRHHIGLVSPKRIIALGSNILPLLGHNVAQDPARFHEFAHDSGTSGLMVGEALESMLSMPRLKARFWRRWLEWTGN